MPRSLSGRLLFLAFSTILAGAIATTSTRADDCSNEKSLKSTPSNTQSELSFQNRSGEKRRIYWIDQDGDRKFYGVVEPGNVFKQETRENHAWVVTDDAEKCLYTFIASAEPRTVDVGQAAANVAAPPPGGQQPIVPPAAPPPAIVQSPPPAAPAPAPVTAAPAPATAPPLDDPPSAMAEIPQISPIEQFDLRGLFRISPRTNPSIAINSEAAGTIFVMNVKPEWTSGQWAFEAVPGLPFVRIRNEWKRTYLTDVDGRLRATAATPDADEAHWTFEPVDGTPFVQFRNRETDRFLIVVGGAPALVDDLRQDQESLSEWKVAPAGRAVAAAPPPPPRNSAYDAALANCRELGGYWTGSSCRASIASKPLVCPRGYAWSEDVGECQWDGGSCPPWQIGPGGVCMTDLTCRGGTVRMSRRGYPACYCPLGYVAWGDYPRLSCVPSVARIAPLLIGGVALGILGANQGRPKIGEVYGNKKFCSPGQTGTPPNCVTAATCPPNLVGKPPNCLRLVPRPTTPVNVTTCPAGQTNCVAPAPTTPPVVGPPTVAPCPANTTGTPPNCVPIKVVRDPTTPTCQGGVVDGTGACKCTPGKAVANGVCVAITCTGGNMIGNTGNCRCNNRTDSVQRTSPTTIVCVAAGTAPQPQIGAAVTTTIDPATGIQTTRTTSPTGVVTTTTACAPGFTGTPPACKSTTATPQTCGPNQVGTPPNCQCAAGRSGPNCAPDAPCDPRTQTGTPGNCVAKVIPCEGGVVDAGSGTCTCGSGKRPVNGVCVAITCNGGQMVGEQCRCNNPNQTPQRTSFSTFTCVGSTAAPCPPDSTGTPPSCTCKTGTTGQPGSCKPVAAATCPADSTGTPPACTCKTGTTGQPGSCKPVAAATCPADSTGTPPACTCKTGTTGQPGSCKPVAAATCPADSTGTPPACTCKTGTTGQPGSCKPVAAATCPADSTGTPPACTCKTGTTGQPGSCKAVVAPVNNCIGGQMQGNQCNCGNGRRLVGNTCVALTCSGGQMIGENCSCNNRTFIARKTGFTTFECVAPAAGGGAVAPRLAPAPVACPAGQVGTQPNCRPAPPATCPAGQIGTPPNCRAAPPATCPAGQVGTPPNCRPAACPAGQVGTPPNCRPAACPAGQIGTPPNCRPAPPATCPAGQIGTPPNCRPAPPATCTAGQVGTPPNCRPPPPPPPQGCAPPKRLNPQGQCV